MKLDNRKPFFLLLQHNIVPTEIHSRDDVRLLLRQEVLALRDAKRQRTYEKNVCERRRSIRLRRDKDWLAFIHWNVRSRRSPVLPQRLAQNSRKSQSFYKNVSCTDITSSAFNAVTARFYVFQTQVHPLRCLCLNLFRRALPALPDWARGRPLPAWRGNHFLVFPLGLIHHR